MATLIAVYDSQGCVGRCDAKCYNALLSECDCICRGMNHSNGERKAADNTREMASRWVEAYKELKGLSSIETRLNHNLVDQLNLF